MFSRCAARPQTMKDYAMLELLQFYVSGFWTWLGLTVGLYVATGGVAMALVYITNLMRQK